MTRRMSCSLTVDAVRDRTKTVTRRHVDTWTTLKPGDRLTLVEKAQGLREGERQIVLAEVEVVSVRVEPISLLADDLRYGRQECKLEGFPLMEPDDFIGMWCQSHGVPTPAACWKMMRPARDWTKCRRIEWRYLDGVDQ